MQTKLIVEILPSGIIVKLFKNFVVKSLGYIIDVPKGFKTDFASVPRLFWRRLPKWGKYSYAAVVHDYLYYSHIVSRKKADLIFKDLMLRNGVSKIKANIMYLAVRIGGKKGWNKKWINNL